MSVEPFTWAEEPLTKQALQVSLVLTYMYSQGSH